jgi:two-component system sensor histidine kinase VicK
LSIQDSEIIEVVRGDEKVLDTILDFITKSTYKIDACMDWTRLALVIENKQIRKLIVNSRNRGVKLRCITEITSNNILHCKQLLEIVDELRHLNGIVGTFYVSDKECLVPALIHEKGKPASQMIYWNAKETVKQHQYMFETLWNKAILAEQKINEIEKGELPETIEIIRNPSDIQELIFKLLKSAEVEILIILSTINGIKRQTEAGSAQLVVEAAKNHNVSVRILTPMDEEVKKIARDLEKQSTNIQILEIRPSIQSSIAVLIVDKKFSLALELKDDTRRDLVEAIGIGTVSYSTSKSTVLSYVSMFESFMELSELYKKSQLKLHDTTDELEAMKRYLHEVLKEVDKFKKTRNGG